MITPMTRVEIVCLSSIREAVIDALQLRGRVHLDETSTELEEAPDFLGRVQLEGEEYDAFLRVEELDRTLAEIAPLLTVEPGGDALRASTKASSGWAEDSWAGKVEKWAASLRDDTSTRASIRDAISVLENYQRILQDVTPALGGSDVKLGKGTRALVLTGRVDKAVARLEERLREELGDTWKLHRKSEKKRLVGLLTFPESKDAEVGRILSQEGVTPVDMRDESYDGATVGEVLKRIGTSLSEQRSALSEVEKRLASTSKEIGADLITVQSLVRDRVAQFHAQNDCAESEMVTVVHGWIPSDFFSDLEKALERDFPGQVVVSDVGQSHEDFARTPTLLKNNKWFTPFEVVLSLFRPPSYGTLDPTPLVAVSFIIFYGFILGDAVYGLAVLFLAHLLAKKLGHIHPAIIAASTIGKYMAYSAIVFGVLYGEYLGNAGERLFENLGIYFPYLFHRAHETTQLLVYALVIGLIHIPLAMILGIKEDFRHGHAKHALEKLGLFMGLIAGVIAVCVYFKTEPFGIPVFTGEIATIWNYSAAMIGVVGVALLFYSMGMMGLIGVLEIMSLGGNVLSYARLMALGVASIALADIANDLPEMMGLIIGVPAALGVHILNIGIGIASPTIHSLRLNFVEFLPKFYSPEGTSFNPFKKETLS